MLYINISILYRLNYKELLIYSHIYIYMYLIFHSISAMYWHVNIIQIAKQFVTACVYYSKGTILFFKISLLCSNRELSVCHQMCNKQTAVLFTCVAIFIFYLVNETAV